MSYVIAVPETMSAAATDLAGIGSTLSEAHIAAAPPTVALVPAAVDEVSAGIAHLFSRYAEDFRGLAGRAVVFHQQFVHHLTAGAGSYAGAEAANIGLLHPLAPVGGAVGVFWNRLLSLFNTAVEGLNFLLTNPLISLRDFFYATISHLLGPVLAMWVILSILTDGLIPFPPILR